MTEKEAKAYIRDHIVFVPRHLKQCREASGYSEYQSLNGKLRCGCPYAGCGPFPGEGYKRKSTGSTSLEKAEKIVLKWLVTGDSRSRDERGTLIADAIKDYMGSVRDANRDEADPDDEPEATLRKYRTLMNQFQAYCDWKGIKHIQEFEGEGGQTFTLEFRNSWEDADAGYKKLHLDKDGNPIWTKNGLGTCRRSAKTMRYFFDRCIERKWLTENPTTILKFKTPQTRNRAKEEVKYLTPKQMTDLFTAIDDLPRMTEYNKLRLSALILTMRRTGLRISDAVLLKRDSIKNDMIYITTKKTKAPAQIPVHPELAEALSKLTPYEGGYLFWNRRDEGADPRTPRSNFNATIGDLFRKAGVKAPSVHHTSHMLRNTFCVDLLEKGVPLETVSLLLTHESIKTTELYYAAFTEGYMDRAARMLKKAYELKEGERLDF
jgi:site-specific recombinase XerD